MPWPTPVPKYGDGDAIMAAPAVSSAVPNFGFEKRPLRPLGGATPSGLSGLYRQSRAPALGSLAIKRRPAGAGTIPSASSSGRAADAVIRAPLEGGASGSSDAAI